MHGDNPCIQHIGEITDVIILFYSLKLVLLRVSKLILLTVGKLVGT